MCIPFSKWCHDVLLSYSRGSRPKPALHSEMDWPNLDSGIVLLFMYCLCSMSARLCRTVCQTSQINSMHFYPAFYKICLRQHLDWWTDLSSETFPLLKITLRAELRSSGTGSLLIEICWAQLIRSLSPTGSACKAHDQHQCLLSPTGFWDQHTLSFLWRGQGSIEHLKPRIELDHILVLVTFQQDQIFVNVHWLASRTWT